MLPDFVIQVLSNMTKSGGGAALVFKDGYDFDFDVLLWK